jgi:hypothetical protein
MFTVHPASVLPMCVCAFISVCVCVCVYIYIYIYGAHFIQNDVRKWNFRTQSHALFIDCHSVLVRTTITVLLSNGKPNIHFTGCHILSQCIKSDLNKKYCIFFKVLSLHTFSGPYIKWFQYSSHFRISHGNHVSINGRKLGSLKVR